MRGIKKFRYLFAVLLLILALSSISCERIKPSGSTEEHTIVTTKPTIVTEEPTTFTEEPTNFKEDTATVTEGSTTTKEEIMLSTSGKGRILAYKDWYFVDTNYGEYKDGLYKNGIFRFNKDFSKGTKFYKGVLDFVHVTDNQLYVAARRRYMDGDGKIYRVDPNKLTMEEMWSYGKHEIIALVDHSAFFLEEDEDSNFSRLCRININGSQKITLTDYIIPDYKCVFSNNSIFYRGDRDPYTIIYKTNCSNNETVKIYETEDIICDQYIVRDSWLYIVVMGLENGSTNLYRIRLDGMKNQIIEKDALNDFDIEGDWIYYAKEDENKTYRTSLYKMKLDGSQKSKFYTLDYAITRVDVTGDRVFFRDSTKYNRVQTIKTDGTDFQNLNQGIK